VSDDSTRRPLSIQQQGVWIVEKLGFSNALYNISHAVRLVGDLDPVALRAACDDLVARHDSLRTAIVEHAGTPMRQVLAAASCDFALRALTATDVALREQELASALRSEASRTFDLTNPPLMRVRLYRLGPREHVMLWILHHIVADGWSVALLGRELREIYAARRAGRVPALEALTKTYDDFVVEQRVWIAGPEFQRDMRYWREQLAGLENIALCGDRPRGARASHRGGVHRFAIGVDLTAQLAALAKRERVTLYMLLLAAFKVLLHRYTGQRDIAVGTPYGARAESGLAAVCGFFTNTLPLRTQLAGNETFRELLLNVRNTVTRGLMHRKLPSDLLVMELGLSRDLGVHPLYPVAFALQSLPEVLLQLEGFECSLMPTHTGTTKTELWLSLTEWQGELQAEIEYSTDLFDAPTIAAFAEHYRNVLTAVTRDPTCRIGELELLGAHERAQLLVEWNSSAQPYELDRAVHTRIEAVAARCPDAIAVECDGSSLSYGDLNRGANQLARSLQTAGTGRGDVVAVCMRRSFELVIALLAVHKAGAAFVPLDPDNPRERLRHILDDSGARLVLAQQSVATELTLEVLAPAVQVLAVDAARDAISRQLDHDLGLGLGADDLAYLIYTSGSTGRPKGVLIPSRGLVNHTLWVASTLGIAAADRVLHQTSISFDAFLWEIFVPLSVGARTVLAPSDRHRDSVTTVKLLCDREITAAFFVPSILRTLLDVAEIAECTRLRFVMCGGEVMDPGLARDFHRLLPDVQLGNFYGPTEASDDATCYLIDRVAADAHTIAIGRPVANTRCRVLDQRGVLLPIGAIGELHIGGAGLALGYHNLPDLTAERFIEDPYLPGGRLYRSGDLARYRRDGQLEYVGRNDAQLKIRGMRVELGEIEAVMAALPGVERCVVAWRGSSAGAPSIVAYVSGADLAIETLRSAAAMQLPDYMVPAVVVRLETWPTLPNGKVDRRALPAPLASEAADTFVPPRGPVEQVLAAIWSELLQRPRVGVNDSFFELGGHSLLATQVLARVRRQLNVDVPLSSMFEAPTIAAQGAVIEALLRGRRSEPPPEPVIVPQPRDKPLPVSYSQRRMWFVQQLDPQGSAYNMPFALRLKGPLDRTALGDALRRIVERHEAFRTTFTVVDGEPVQRVAAYGDLSPHLTDLRASDAARQQHQLLELLRANAMAAFDLAQGPLARVLLVCLSDDDHVLQLVVHHAISDQWSAGIIARELAEHYQAARAGQQPNVAPLDVQYADYAAWQRQALTHAALASQVAYWRVRLEGLMPLALATDRPRPKRQSFAGSHVSVALSPELLAALRSFSAARGASMFMTLLATYQLLLARYSGQHDIAVGTPIANRTRLVTERLVGTLVNTLVMRTRVEPSLTFSELIAQVRTVALEAYANQDVPFERLVDELGVARDASVSPLVQVLFNVVNAPMAQPSLAGLTVEPLDFDSGGAQFDLSLTVDTEVSGKVYLVYSTALYERTSAMRMLEQYVRLLSRLIAAPERPIGSHDLLSDLERWQILRDWNSTTRDYPRHLCADQLIAAQAERSPTAIAVKMGAETLTYRQLEQRASQFARWLQHRGVARGATLGLLIDRSPHMLVVLLGVMKASAAYVPLDPAFPRERLAFMVQDAGVAAIIAERAYAALLPDGPPRFALEDIESELAAMPIHAPPRAPTAPDNLAYVLYTSGSTGRPKGVEVPHRALTNFLTSMQREPGCAAGDKLLALTTLSFDIAGLELYLPLTVGASVELASRAEIADGRLLRRRLEAADPDICQATPASWRMLIDAGWQGSTKLTVLCGGEALSRELADALMKRAARVWNLYGPTETTIWSSLDAVRGDGEITIGRPIANTSLYVLDAHGQPAPIGVPGELYIGGDGLAHGYRGQPELTRERFVENRFSDRAGSRLYRTGDAGKYLPDGRVVHLGRLDTQIKLRGHRIELAEIESQLAMHPGVARCALGIRGRDADQRLVAWVVKRDGAAIDADLLRAWLRSRLPEYMVPSAIVFVAALSLTANHKVDIRALPDPAQLNLARPSETAEPSGWVEVQLASIWSQVLAVDGLGVHHDFFAAGGHSLKAVELLTRVEQVFGRALPLALLLEAPTIATMAKLLTESGWQPKWRSLVAIQSLGDEVPLFAVPGAGGNVLVFAVLARLLGKSRPVYGLQSIGLDGRDKPFTEVERAAHLYVTEIREIQPRGPYFVMGTCTGGVFAYEIAQQLTQDGETVVLAIVESWHPRSYRRSALPMRALWPILFATGRANFYARELGQLPLREWPRYAVRKLAVALRFLGDRMQSKVSTPAVRIEHVTAATMSAVARYAPKPIRLDLLNVVATHRPLADNELDTRRDWERLALGQHQVAGIAAPDSGQLFVTPHVEQLARVLAAYAAARLPGTSAAAHDKQPAASSS
jgi:amino acid adenylation domain-containing protein